MDIIGELASATKESVSQSIENVLPEIGQELGRMAVQGTAELGSAMFTGQGYVPYGQGQNREGSVHGLEGLHQGGEELQPELSGKEVMQHEHELGGRSM